MSLSKLSQDCHVHIYNYLHLTDLIHLRLLCRSLNASFILHSHYRHLLSVKVSSIKSKDITTSEPNDLFCFTLNSHLCSFLLTTFPNITHLQIQVSSNPNPNLLKHISHLLSSHWSTRLQSLQLELNYPTYHQHGSVGFFTSHLTNLHDTINDHLLHLTSLHYRLVVDDLALPIDLPILARLTHFTLDSNTSLSNIYHSLVHYALPSTTLKTVNLVDIEMHHREDVQARLKLFQLNDTQHTRTKFISLGPHLPLTGHHLMLYAYAFTSLRYLCVNLYPPVNANYLPLHQVTALLATHMHRLETLKLEVDFTILPDDDDHDHPPLPCTPLPSVKVLHLKFNLESHRTIRRYLRPRRTFPNVEKVSTQLSHIPCGMCNYRLHMARFSTRNHPELVAAAREKLEAPFEKCPQFKGPVVHVDDEADVHINYCVHESLVMNFRKKYR